MSKDQFYQIAHISKATALFLLKNGLGEFIAKHKKAFLIVGGILAMIFVISTIVSSCSVMFQSMSSTINSTTYPLEDSDMLAAEAAYCGMESKLS